MTSFKPRFCRSPHDFETAARDWLRHWGYSDATLTRTGPDDGIDVLCKGAIAQVKSWMTPIGIAEVQRLKGAAYEGKRAYFFSLMEYTDGAMKFADAADVYLFRFKGYDGSVQPVNRHAKSFVEQNRIVRLFHARRTPESWVGEHSTLELLSLVSSAFQEADETSSFSIINVLSSVGRYVQFNAKPLVLETVGPANIGEMDLYTNLQLECLAAIGWPEEPDGRHGNFVWPKACSVLEYASIATNTLVTVHGVVSSEDVDVYVDKPHLA